MNRLKQKEGVDRSAWSKRADVLSHVQNGQLDGFFDTSAGFTYADKACTWARHLAERAGVKFVLGPEIGKLDELLIAFEGGKKLVTGLRTIDGKEHTANVVVVAGKTERQS